MPSKEILKLDRALHSVASTIDTTRINPVNAEQIKHTHHKNEPEFNYPIPILFSSVQEKLHALSFPHSPEGDILKKKQQYLLDKVALLTAVGTKQFFAMSKRIHPLPDAKLVRRAMEILEKKHDTNSEQVRLMDAYQEMQETIKQIGIPWRVQKINMIASAAVMPSQRLLYLKRKMQFSRRFIERLKIHEIGTHAARAENGRLQPLKIFLHGFANYLPTEEGLAVYNEEKFGLLDNTVFRTYAGRVLAVHTAANHTFTETVEELKKYFLENKALTLALRAKRGVASGDQKGGYTKDSAYLKGYTALKKYDANGGDFTPLYYGKVGLDDLPSLKNIPWLVKPKFFPDMIKLKQ